MPIQRYDLPQHRSSELHGAIAQQLSEMYLRLDECWFTGGDRVELDTAIQAIERQHAGLFCPCHLCEKPTIFIEAAYELPFCWHCLHERYDLWYRSVRYHRSGSRK